MWSRNSSKRGDDPSTGGLNTAAQPTCIWAVALSASRNEASSEVNRLRTCRASFDRPLVSHVVVSRPERACARLGERVAHQYEHVLPANGRVRPLRPPAGVRPSRPAIPVEIAAAHSPPTGRSSRRPAMQASSPVLLRLERPRGQAGRTRNPKGGDVSSQSLLLPARRPEVPSRKASIGGRLRSCACSASSTWRPSATSRKRTRPHLQSCGIGRVVMSER